MRTCAIDIHHHYFPPGVLEEGKRHGSALGVEVGETKEGLSTVSIGGAAKFVIPPNLLKVEHRLSTMDKGKIAIATLEPHTACLGYRLDGEKGEARSIPTLPVALLAMRLTSSYILLKR